MTTVTARPKKDKNHIVVEHFTSEIIAEQWKRMIIKNGWEVINA